MPARTSSQLQGLRLNACAMWVCLVELTVLQNDAAAGSLYIREFLGNTTSKSFAGITLGFICPVAKTLHYHQIQSRYLGGILWEKAIGHVPHTGEAWEKPLQLLAEDPLHRPLTTLRIHQWFVPLALLPAGNILP